MSTKIEKLQKELEDLKQENVKIRYENNSLERRNHQVDIFLKGMFSTDNLDEISAINRNRMHGMIDTMAVKTYLLNVMKNSFPKVLNGEALTEEEISEINSILDDNVDMEKAVFILREEMEKQSEEEDRNALEEERERQSEPKFYK